MVEAKLPFRVLKSAQYEVCKVNSIIADALKSADCYGVCNWMIVLFAWLVLLQTERYRQTEDAGESYIEVPEK